MMNSVNNISFGRFFDPSTSRLYRAPDRIRCNLDDNNQEISSKDIKAGDRLLLRSKRNPDSKPIALTAVEDYGSRPNSVALSVISPDVSGAMPYLKDKLDKEYQIIKLDHLEFSTKEPAVLSESDSQDMDAHKKYYEARKFDATRMIYAMKRAGVITN
jgi:hypothetical protein